MKIEFNNSRVALILALPVFVYINIRAMMLAFTYDECWTYLGYATEDFWKVVTNEFPAANNHVLHSLVMGWFYDMFGQYEYALRLPVLISFVVFTFFIYKISKQLSAKMWWMPFILIVYQPYLLDYFVAARGYALAMAFMFGSIYFIYLFAEKPNMRRVWSALIFASLAAYSNFTYLLFFIAVVLCVLAISVQKRKVARTTGVIGLVSIVLAVIVYKPITQLIAAKELYYGGVSGFFNDTLSTLARSFVYGTSEVNVLSWFFALVIALAGVLALAKFLSRTALGVGFWLTFILIAIETGSILQHHLIGSPYLIDRTAIFFIPLILFALSWIVLQLKEGLIRNIVAFAFIFLSLINVLSSLNVSYLLDFKEYADADKAIQMIYEDDSLPQDGFSIGKSIYMNAPINFYRVKYGLERIEQSGLEYCEETQNTKYYYMFEKDISCLEDKDVELMQYFPISRTYLYRAM